MNKNSRRLLLALLVLAIFIIAAAALRTTACIKDLEDNLIYFESNALIISANVIVVVGAVLAIALSVAMHKECLRASFSSPSTYVPTGITSAALALLMLVLIATYGALSANAGADPRVGVAANLALIAALLAPLSIAHLFLTAFLTERHTVVRAWFSLATVAFLAVYAAFLYFSASTPLNSHNKIMEEMAYLFAAIFFLYESRISLGREMWRPYIAFGMLATLLTAYASLPAIITYLVRGELISSTFESAVFLLSLAIFTSARLITLASVSYDGISEEMAVLADFAARRQDALDRPAIEDGTQISIEELIDITPEKPMEADEDNTPENEDNEIGEIIPTPEFTEDA